MRRPLTRKARAPKGSRVSFVCSLPEGQQQAILSVFTGTPGFDLSPYVNPDQLGISVDGLPLMIQPMYRTLRPEFPAHTFSFTAHEDMFVQLVQDIDVATDPSAKAKVHVSGKIAPKIRWLCRDAIRAVRNGYDSVFRRNRNRP